MVLSENELMAVAVRLAAESGEAVPIALHRLHYGRNNRAFKVVMADGPPRFLKSYFSHPLDTRQRLASEWAFLKYAWEQGVRTIAKPIAADWETQTALYSFLGGSHLKAGEVSLAHVSAAADFIIAVNSPPRKLESLSAGSEACFSLSQHIATIDRRVRRLGGGNVDTPHHHRVDKFARKTLLPVWGAVRTSIERCALRFGLELEQELSQGERIASPSDFGFHNTLIDDAGRLAFIDFEYAGRDDPAKLVCDFFCQPQVPVSLDYYEHFLSELGRAFECNTNFELRCRLLLNAYRVKWACIILNEFQSVGAEQRAFASGELTAQRCKMQLRKAEAKLAEVTTD